jgi:hypothetical protein
MRGGESEGKGTDKVKIPTRNTDVWGTPFYLPTLCRGHSASSLARLRSTGQVLPVFQLTINCRVAVCVVLLLADVPVTVIT